MSHALPAWGPEIDPPLYVCLDCRAQLDDLAHAQQHMEQTEQPVDEPGNVTSRSHTVRSYNPDDYQPEGPAS